MLPIRTPLRSISGNRPKGSEITPYMRGQITRQAFKDTKLSEIARDLKLDRSTVNYILQQDQLRDDGHSLPRTPSGKSYTDTEEQFFFRHVRLNPKNTYKQVIAACRLSCKPAIVKKILKRYSICN
jgi:hypothetical protein